MGDPEKGIKGLIETDNRRFRELVDRSLGLQFKLIRELVKNGMHFWDYGNSFMKAVFDALCKSMYRAVYVTVSDVLFHLFFFAGVIFGIYFLEDREMLELFVKDIKGFAEIYIKNTDYLFIDEFQYAREGGKQLKFLYDGYSTKIIISGSSAIDLSVQSLKFLVGRMLKKKFKK